MPVDVFREASLRAGARRWNFSDYVAWCVEKEVGMARLKALREQDPTTLRDEIDA